jgi:hypothetical protein
MSTIVTMVTSKSVFVWTDGGSWDESGVLTEISRKCSDVPGTTMVVTGRGLVIIGDFFLEYLVAAEVTEAQVVDEGERLFERFLKSDWGEEALAYEAPFDFCLAGWNSRDARPFVVTYHYRPGEPAKYFVITDEFSLPGLPDKEVARVRREVGVGLDYDRIDPLAFGKAMMGAMRRTPFKWWVDKQEVCIVGGHILQTEVSAAGVTHRIVHTWPDKIGERIDPAARHPTKVVGGFGSKKQKTPKDLEKTLPAR